MVPLFHPRRDLWRDHFVWSMDLLQVIAITPIGRVTLARLHVNRVGAVNIRRALLALGETHPPDDTD